MELDKSTLSRTVDSLVREGFATRITDTDDRRAVKIGLSEKGAEKARTINTLCDKYYEEILSGIPLKERKEVIESVAVLAESMRSFRTRTSCCGNKGESDE